MTLTSHSTKEKWSLSWICFVLSFKSPFTVTCPKKIFKNLCIFYCLPICPLCFNVNPKSDKSVNQWSWSFRIIHGCFEGKEVLNSLMAQIREWMGFALHLIKRRKASEGILWSYWSLWKQKPKSTPVVISISHAVHSKFVRLSPWFLFNRTKNQCFTFITKCEKQIMWKVYIHSLGCKTHLSVHVMWWVGKWSELFDYNEFVWLKD